MDETQLPKIAAWVTDAGLAGASENMLLAGFSERAIEAGLPLARASVLIDTRHPIDEGRVFGWERDKDEIAPRDYARSSGSENDGRWRRSPFYRLLETGDSFLRRRLTPANDGEFSIFPELRAAGMTDYTAII